MFIPTSSEFVALCRAQIALLTQGLGASLSVVYLTPELVDGSETRLVPIAAYPESAITRQGQALLPLPQTETNQSQQLPRLIRDANVPPTLSLNQNQLGLPSILDVDNCHDGDKSSVEQPTPPEWECAATPNRASLVTQRQLVLPLMHEQVVMGLLVTERSDRAWTEWERTQIQKIADTLANACVLDQRYQWLDQTRRQERLIQSQQHDMLDNLLHQFRNSLTALQTFSKLILKRLLPGDANRDIAASITREANRLRELSDQLEAATIGYEEAAPPVFLLSAADVAEQPGQASGNQDDQRPLLPAAGLTRTFQDVQPILVTTVLEPLLASAAAIAQTRNISLHGAIAPNVPPVWGNEQALREVLNNLIENALKYTPEGGSVLVRVTLQAAGRVEITVTDTGPGIPAPDLPHIFERRFRGVQAQSAIPGSGLGLAIAHSLITQMHGKIQVFSPAQPNDLDVLLRYGVSPQGPGTTFAVQLPVDRELR